MLCGKEKKKGKKFKLMFFASFGSIRLLNCLNSPTCDLPTIPLVSFYLVSCTSKPLTSIDTVTSSHCCYSFDGNELMTANHLIKLNCKGHCFVSVKQLIPLDLLEAIQLSCNDLSSKAYHFTSILWNGIDNRTDNWQDVNENWLPYLV